MKQFHIPFTNISLSIGTNAVGAPPQVQGKRGFQFGRFSGDAVRDLFGKKLGFDIFYETYRTQSDVTACIREWRDNVGLGGYKWVVPDDNEAEVKVDVVKRLDGILNKGTRWRATVDRVVRDLGVTGNAYLEIVRGRDTAKTVNSLSPLDPRTMSIVSDVHGNILKYIQRVSGGMVEFQPEDIIHFKLDSDPAHELFGLSPLEPVIWEAKTDLSAMMANYYFFENDAQPAVQYILDNDNFTKEQLEEAAAYIESEFKGVKNRNRAAVMAGVKEIKTISVSQKDMQFLEGRKFTTEKICAAFGTPKFLLGYTESVNNNNGVELKSDFYQSTIQPIEENIAEVITQTLVVQAGYAGLVAYQFKPQTFDEQASIEERALKEYHGGAITLRQYKKKTNQEISEADEQIENFDKYIFQGGSSAVLIEDVGVDAFVDDGNGKTAQNLINELKKYAKSAS